MKRVDNTHIVCVTRQGHLIVFDSRAEYDAFIKTPETKTLKHLYATPKVLADAIDRGCEAEEERDKLLAWLRDHAFGDDIKEILGDYD